MMFNASFFVITGGPGAGKTTLLNELANRGHQCVPEVARELIKEQVAGGGEALPWKDTGLYTQLMLERSVESYRSVSQVEMNSVASGIDSTATRIDSGATKQRGKPITFFDRGIPDTLCYARLIKAEITEEMDRVARDFRYNKKVFMLPPWQEIYQTDTERKQTWEEVIHTFKMMVNTYEMYGYEVIEVPKTAVNERVEFVEAKITEEMQKK